MALFRSGVSTKSIPTVTPVFAEVLLPLPLSSTFTYLIPDSMASEVGAGYRVVVPFGARKFYTGIVISTGNVPPRDFDAKPIAAVLDKEPIIRRPQLQLWDWVADYYLCSTGEVYRAAVPSGLKLESETFVELAPDFEPVEAEKLDERETMVYHVLAHEMKKITVGELGRLSGVGNISAVVGRMLDKEAVIVSEKLVERYRSRKVSYVRIAVERYNPGVHRAMFESVDGAPKQQKVLMTLLELSAFTRRDTELREVTVAQLIEASQCTRPIIAALEKKGLLEVYVKEINRFRLVGVAGGELPILSTPQKLALDSIHKSWLDHDITLLHGVTSSGKTEIYMHLIEDVMKRGRQVLYLVPEIALTTQLTRRLQRVFGDKVVIYHSKFTDNERVDIWRKVLSSREPMVVIGARSALFLPFADLGLVIVDEEHETSYKQQDPAPRYNGRDVATVLAGKHGAKTLLGSATPAIDTYYKALTGRYGLVTLSERYSGVALPEIRIIDTKAAMKAGKMKGPLAPDTVELVSRSVAEGGQAILFLNRRGYAPVATCKMCAWTPKCEHCDVTLTYHKYIDRLVCHYCGAVYPLPTLCPQCKEPAVEIYGYGTERMEDEVSQAFPDAEIMRMDLDTTRNKDGYERIITDFSQGKAQILVGTQMVTKGLDFERVRTVGIVNADAMINQPDFRASERAFNMMSQVAGRAGRRGARGTVVIQTRDSSHPILPFVAAHDYRGFYESEILEREKYNYPPFTRLIYIYVKHRDRRTAEELAKTYSERLRQLFGTRIYGPEEPHVSRIQTLYIRKIMLKIELGASPKKVKQILRAVYEEMHARRVDGIKSAVIYYDVDPY